MGISLNTSYADNLSHNTSVLSNALANGWQNLTNIFGMNTTQQQNQFNHDEAELAFQRSLEASNTSYQRAVQDLAKAGLNPYLAYQQGGASTPSSGQAVASGSGNLLSAILPIVGSVLGIAKTAMQANSAQALGAMRKSAMLDSALIHANSAEKVATLYAGRYSDFKRHKYSKVSLKDKETPLSDF